MRILVTGSEGLIGKSLCTRLVAAGRVVLPFDISRGPSEDIKKTDELKKALSGVSGIVHLAAVSRVVVGEKNPDLCLATNVDALSRLLVAVQDCRDRPWLIFASSREVYGRATELPVAETAVLSPVNVYARSKVEGERLTLGAREAGLWTNLCRFSTVYGRTDDHSDRLIPAFARVAANGGELRVDGGSTTVDATHVDDVADGMMSLIDATSAGERLPPLHFVSGKGTSIADLAHLAKAVSSKPVSIRLSDPRSYDVGQFIGDPTRCRQLLGWSSKIPIEAGFQALVRDFEAQSS